MIGPTLTRLLDDFWMLKLKADVFEIVSESITRQPFDIFKYECGWAYLANSTHSLRKHIPGVFVSFMFSAQRKGLARWTARNQI